MNTRKKHKTLLDALNTYNKENHTDYMHHESTMYQWERPTDLYQKLEHWKLNLEKDQKIMQYFNVHVDNRIPLVRTHLVYQAKNSHVLSVFSCNLDNLNSLNLDNLNINESKKGALKLPYLLSKVEAENIKAEFKFESK